MTALNQSPLPLGEGQGEGSNLPASTVLTENLPLLAGAPNGIKKLRELILELAVRGKLVPQDPNDEPASELLKRIAEEKARLVAEGKIKKQKLLADIGDDEKSFELPACWAWQRFADFALDVSTGPFGSLIHQSDYVDGGIPLVNPSHMIDGRILADQSVSLSAEMAENLASYRLSEGDMVMARRGEVGRVALVTGAEEGWLCGTGSFVLRFTAEVSRAYVWTLFRCNSVRTYLAGAAVGTTMVNLNHGILLKMPIAVPPLAEQHRIVAKVDELMALCDRLEAQQADAESAHAQLVQALLDSLTQASDANDFAANWQRLAEHFHTLFTTEPSIDALKQTLLQLAVMGKLVPQDPSDEPARALVKRIQAEKQRYLAESKARKQKDLATDSRTEPPFEVPAGWEWQTIDDVLHVTGGVTLGRKLGGRKVISKPYLRVANVQRGRLELDHIKEVEVPEDEVEKYLLQNGDLLITEGGDWDKVGRTATWRDELPECLHQNHVFRARAVVSDWEPRWAEMYLNSASAREYFAGSSKQTTNLASINMTQLRACAFPLPPLPEQHRIVAKVDQLMALCDQLKTRLTQARQLNEQLASTLVEQAVA